MSPYADPARRQASQTTYESRRRAATTRLRIALRILEEYGCLWEYERACADEGIPDPLLLPGPRRGKAVA